MTADDRLEQFIAHEIATPVPGIDALIDHIRGRFGDSVAAILFYGSCLRTGDFENKILDFYVLVDSYRAAYGSGWLALANRVVPPNVFYGETDGPSFRLRAKYAVLSVSHFHRLCGCRTFNSSVWVRFAQPTRLVYGRDPQAQSAVVRALASAVTTSLRSVVGLVGEPVTAERLWRELFRESYRVEFRAEGGTRARDIYNAARDRYEAITPLALSCVGYEPAGDGRFQARTGQAANPRWQRIAWFLRTWQGKTLSVLRLVKATFTFDGGIDYLAWKIQRHSGVEITITPWQRRHPLLAGLVLFVQLRLKGAFR
ncbi:MAG: hypothetical protein D6763_05150 [Alphaproteobacteria bacterium]|nr:MAG: hypothetical protein D6763_05150 [Alphaproteobacteria bacterium]